MLRPYGKAMDAAERVDVAYEPLAAMAQSRDALAPGAPPVWAGHDSNLCIDSEAGDREATKDAFAHAAHVDSSCQRRHAGLGKKPGRQHDDVGAVDAADCAMRFRANYAAKSSSATYGQPGNCQTRDRP